MEESKAGIRGVWGKINKCRMDGGNEMMTFDPGCRMWLPLTVNQVKGRGNTICLAVGNPR